MPATPSTKTNDGGRPRQRVGIACAYCEHPPSPSPAPKPNLIDLARLTLDALLLALPAGRYRKIKCCGSDPCQHCRDGRRVCLYVSVEEWQTFHKGVRVDHPPAPAVSTASSSSASANDSRSGPKKKRANPSAVAAAKKQAAAAARAAAAASSDPASSLSPGAEPSIDPPTASTSGSRPAGRRRRSNKAEQSSSAAPASAALTRESSASSSPPAGGLPSFPAQAQSLSWLDAYSSGSTSSVDSPARTGSLRLPSAAAYFSALGPQSSALSSRQTSMSSLGITAPRHYQHSRPPSPFYPTHPVFQHSYYTASTVTYSAQGQAQALPGPLRVMGWVPPAEPHTSTTPLSSAIPAALRADADYYHGFAEQDLARMLGLDASSSVDHPEASSSSAGAVKAEPASSSPPDAARKPSVSYNSSAQADLAVLLDFGVQPSTLDDFVPSPPFDGAHDIPGDHARPSSPNVWAGFNFFG